jgi:O-antigen/teichoic acid export membrane protein
MHKKIINTFGTRMLNAFVNLFIAIIISNKLGVEGKGEQGIILATITIVSLLTGIIGPASLTYHFPRYQKSVLIFSSYIWLLISSIGVLLAFLYSNIIQNQFIGHIVILSTILSTTSINLSILVANQKIKENNLVNNIQTLLTLLPIIMLFYTTSKPTINHYLISVYFGFSAGFIVSFVYAFKYYELKGLLIIGNWIKPLRSMISLGMFNQLAILSQMFSFRLSYYILDQLFGMDAVGVYSNGISIAESIWIISRSIALVQKSVIVNTINKAYSVQLTKTLLWINLIASGVCIIPLVLLPAEAYSFIFGQGFDEIVYIVRILAPGILFFSIVLIAGHYFSATGKHYFNSIASVSGLVVTIITSLILIPRWGIYGAGIASTISYFITAIITLLFFIKDAELRLKDLIPKYIEIKHIMQLLKTSVLKR